LAGELGDPGLDARAVECLLKSDGGGEGCLLRGVRGGARPAGGGAQAEAERHKLAEGEHREELRALVVGRLIDEVGHGVVAEYRDRLRCRDGERDALGDPKLASARTRQAPGSSHGVRGDFDVGLIGVEMHECPEADAVAVHPAYVAGAPVLQGVYDA
jgi:hypothetical protein